MGILYRETIIRRKMPVIVMIIMIIFAVSAIESIIDQIALREEENRKIDTFLLVITMFIIGYEAFKCKIVYKYSIIENRLVINKVLGTNSKVVEKVFFNEIIYIGKPSSPIFNLARGKKYTGNTFNEDTVCCIYKRNNKLNKFYFEPSKSMMNKIDRIKQAV